MDDNDLGPINGQIAFKLEIIA